MRKPDYTNVIPEKKYKNIAWPLLASGLLYAGPNTRRKLTDVNIHSIGNLAKNDTLLEGKLGKSGVNPKAYACGANISPVMYVDYSMA